MWRILQLETSEALCETGLQYKTVINVIKELFASKISTITRLQVGSAKKSFQLYSHPHGKMYSIENRF